METLAQSLDDLHPEKKYFLFLAKLGRANIVTLSSGLRLSDDFARALRQRLVILSEYYRYNHFFLRSTAYEFCRFLRSTKDPLWVVSEACSVIAQCTSYRGQALTMNHILQTLYFAVVIMLQLISNLAIIQRADSRIQTRMTVLTTAIHWLDQTLFGRFDHVIDISDIELLEGICSLRALALACVFIRFSVFIYKSDVQWAH